MQGESLFAKAEWDMNRRKQREITSRTNNRENNKGIEIKNKQLENKHSKSHSNADPVGVD